MLQYLRAKSLLTDPVDVTGEDALDSDKLFVCQSIGDWQGVSPGMQGTSWAKSVNNGLGFIEPEGKC